MQYKVQSFKKLSIFELKQQYIDLLTSELENCRFHMALRFEAGSKNRICTVKFADCKRVEICANLEHVNKSVCIGNSSGRFKVRYCVLFIAAYIKQIERAMGSLPQSYFEGLAFLNAIEVYKSEKNVSVYSPLAHWDKGPKRACCLRPLEISSAINALNKVKVSLRPELSEEERGTVNTFYNQLLLYAGLPEVSYVHASVPVYTLTDACKKLAILIHREPKLVQEFPILALTPFGQIGQWTVNELFLHCIQSDTEFLMGVAIRLIAFLLPWQDISVTDDMQQKVVDSMKQYIDDCIAYYSEVPKEGRNILRDNLLAVKMAAKAINGYLAMQGISVNGGNIHYVA